MLRTVSLLPSVPATDPSAPATKFNRAASLRFEGDLDTTTASEFISCVYEQLAAGVTRLFVDIDDLHVVDDSGMAALERIHEERAKRGALIIWSRRPTADQPDA